MIRLKKIHSAGDYGGPNRNVQSKVFGLGTISIATPGYTHNTTLLFIPQQDRTILRCSQLNISNPSLVNNFSDNLSSFSTFHYFPYFFLSLIHYLTGRNGHEEW